MWAADKVSLVYWSMWNQGEPQAQVIQSWIDGFEASNPSITITPTWNGRQNQTLLRNALAAGTKVDLMDQDSDQVAGGLVAAEKAYPLNDFLNGKALDEDGTIAGTFVPGVLHMFDLNGKTYLWPYIYNTCQFIYNKALLTKAGAQVPNTWDDFLAECGALKNAGIVPIALEGDSQSYNANYFVYLLERIKGRGWLTKAATDKTGATWKDPVVMTVCKMERDLWAKGYVPADSKGYKWPQAQQTLAAGESTMELVGSWLPTELASAAGPDFEWGQFNFPEVKNGKGKLGDLMAYTLSFMVLKDTQHPKEVLQFLKYTVTKDNQMLMAKKGNVGVTRKGVDWPKNLTDAQKAAENAKIVFGEGDGLQASNAELWVKVIRDPHNDMIDGIVTPEQFIDNLVTGTRAYWKNK
jgi:raffinose/stachyose/melibiose transport system substrate-binding protein